jgi:aryl-alcohol dehydrogenase-like predicted oxidoreductase
MKRYGPGVYYQIADDLIAHAREKGVSPVSLAVAWVMSHPAVTAPIIGARNVEQLQGSLGALEIDMTPEWREQISALSITPPPATDRLEVQSGTRGAETRAK